MLNTGLSMHSLFWNMLWNTGLCNSKELCSAYLKCGNPICIKCTILSNSRYTPLELQKSVSGCYCFFYLKMKVIILETTKKQQVVARIMPELTY